MSAWRSQMKHIPRDREVFIGRDRGRVAFEISRDPKRPKRWRMWRASVSCWESGFFSSASEAMEWGSKLNPHVGWSREEAASS